MSWFGLGAEVGTANNPIEAEAAAAPSPSTAGSQPPSSLSRSSRLEGRTSNAPTTRSSADPPTGSSSSSSSSAVNNYHSMMQDHQDALPRSSPSSKSTAAAISVNTRRQQEKQPSSPKRRNSVPSSPTSDNINQTSSYAYRGFSTSIGDMFVHPSNERVDCCAMVCCGIFQSDRDRYLLQGIAPPSPWKRVWVHAVVPIILFCMAGYVALNIPNKMMNQLLVLIFLLGLLTSIVLQCQKGRHKRMDIRKDVLWYKYQLHQHRKNNSQDDDDAFSSLDQILDRPRPHDMDDDNYAVDHYYYRGQSARDIGCAHPYCFLLGCYPTDRRPRGGQLLAAGDDHQVEESLCQCLFQNLCGRDICGKFLCQLGGVCGMAQESREIESALLPPAYRRLDYVSMQPMLAYFEKIYNQRWRQFHTLNTSGIEGPRAVGPFDFQPQQEGWLPYIPLSGLSITILQGWVALSLWLGIWSVLGPIFWTQMVKGAGRRHYFSVPDYIVYLASWLVCFGTFAVVVYLVQRRKPLELSVDSMIKYFASGFVLSTTLAIFYELVVGLSLRLMILVYMAFSGINVVEDREYNMEWIRQPLSQGFAGGPSRIYTEAAATDGEDYLPVFGRDHPFVYSIYLFFTAFFLAALVEEICKYFGFRMIESPDFLSRKDLEDAARAGAVGDTEDNLNYKQHDESQGQQTNRRVSFPHHGESLEAQGASITVAMVCVALGFSICEDMIYIFLYNGSSVEMELYVLIARTLFPIHPIAAALQSIGVVQRDVEKSPTRFGRILLPAVLFHGTYDFLLLWIDFLVSLKRSDGYHDNDDEALEVGGHALILSYSVSAAVMGSALYWFYKESNKQRDRLAARDADPHEIS